MPQTIIGIDLGEYSVKVAEITRSFRSFSFTNFYERRVQYNDLLSPEECRAIALQGLIDDHGLRWDAAMCGFPGQLVSSRLVTFPFSGSKKIAQTVQFEIETQVPFNVDDIVVDYAVLWSTKEASRVMVVYVQKADLARELGALQKVNVEPRAVCVEGVELLSLVTLGMVPPEGAYAIIDIGYGKTTVTICQGKRLSFVRAISHAGRAITQSIADRLGVPFDEAERLKIEMGNVPVEELADADEITIEVTAAIRSSLDELLLHLRQTLFTFRDTEGVPVEGVYLCGGTSRLPGLDRYLTISLKQNVAFLNPADFHFSHLSHPEAHRHVIPQALALALKGVAASGTPDINLRQGDFAFTGDVEELGGNVKYIGGVLLLVLLLALANFSIKYYALKSKLANVQLNIRSVVAQTLPDAPRKSLDSAKTALALIRAKQQEVSDRTQQLGKIIGTSPVDVLREVSQRLPARGDIKLDVDSFTATTDRASFSGFTDSFEAVNKIKQSLEQSPLFRSVTTGNVRKGTKDEIKFDVTIELGSGGAKGG